MYIGIQGAMESGIQLLEIASGLKESLLKAGFTLDSISSEGPDAVSAALGIESYIAKIIYDEAKKITAESSVVAS
jgi:poly(3-hydroxyalkanoate) synthetase